MRILHTSDWHLGRTLYGHSRLDEQERFLDELVEIARGVDLVLITGDVFESTSPPPEAEELLHDALARLGDGGRRGVVVIAGDHDPPERLSALAPLASAHGVWLLGRPGEQVRQRRAGSQGVALVESGPSLLKLALPRGERVVIAAVPYMTEAGRPLQPPPEQQAPETLEEALAPEAPAFDEPDPQEVYNRKVAALFTELSRSFEPGAVNLAMGHLAVRSCTASRSERTPGGGMVTVEGSVLPRAQYVALGHLHLAQQVLDSPTLARYAGSPLALRFSERDFPRNHLIVELFPKKAPRVEMIPIQSGRPLVCWKASSLSEVERRAERGEDADAFIDLELQLSEQPPEAELARLHRLQRTFLRIRVALPEACSSTQPSRWGTARTPSAGSHHNSSIAELFRAFYQKSTGREPDRELTELVLELTSPPPPVPDLEPERAVG